MRRRRDGVALIVLLVRGGAPARARRAAFVLLAVTLAQGLIGYVQYFNDIPATLVAAHVAGATALWLVTVRFTLAALEPLAAHAPDADDVHAMEPAAERQIVFQAAPTV